MNQRPTSGYVGLDSKFRSHFTSSVQDLYKGATNHLMSPMYNSKNRLYVRQCRAVKFWKSKCVRIYKIYGDQWKNTEHLKNVQEMVIQICASHSDYVRPDRPGIVMHFIP